jgi:hypothetical protein
MTYLWTGRVRSLRMENLVPAPVTISIGVVRIIYRHTATHYEHRPWRPPRTMSWGSGPEGAVRAPSFQTWTVQAYFPAAHNVLERGEARPLLLNGSPSCDPYIVLNSRIHGALNTFWQKPYVPPSTSPPIILANIHRVHTHCAVPRASPTRVILVTKTWG